LIWLTFVRVEAGDTGSTRRRLQRIAAMETFGRKVVVKPATLHDWLAAKRAWPLPHSASNNAKRNDPSQ
jgi:hypothetical protein